MKESALFCVRKSGWQPFRCAGIPNKRFLTKKKIEKQLIFEKKISFICLTLNWIPHLDFFRLPWSSECRNFESSVVIASDSQPEGPQFKTGWGLDSKGLKCKLWALASVFDKFFWTRDDSIKSFEKWLFWKSLCSKIKSSKALQELFLLNVPILPTRVVEI